MHINLCQPILAQLKKKIGNKKHSIWSSTGRTTLSSVYAKNQLTIRIDYVRFPCFAAYYFCFLVLRENRLHQQSQIKADHLGKVQDPYKYNQPSIRHQGFVQKVLWQYACHKMVEVSFHLQFPTVFDSQWLEMKYSAENRNMHLLKQGEHFNHGFTEPTF